MPFLAALIIERTSLWLPSIKTTLERSDANKSLGIESHVRKCSGMVCFILIRQVPCFATSNLHCWRANHTTTKACSVVHVH